MSKPTAKIIYATLTGCNEDLAMELADKLKNKDIDAEAVDVMDGDAAEFKEADICIVVSYSYENEDEILPDEMLEFYDNLGKVDLTGKVYGVLGTGDTIYEDYCGAVDKLEKQFEKTGATKGSESLKMDIEYVASENGEDLKRFVREIIQKQQLLQKA